MAIELGTVLLRMQRGFKFIRSVSWIDASAPHFPHRHSDTLFYWPIDHIFQAHHGSDTADMLDEGGGLLKEGGSLVTHAGLPSQTTWARYHVETMLS